MRSTVARGIGAASLVLAAALLSACGSTGSATAPNPPNSASVPAADAPGTPGGTEAPQAGEEEHPEEPESYGCDEVQAANGEKLLAYADATPAGAPDCADVTKVFRGYYERAATESEGSARSLVVDGWSCTTDTTSNAQSVTACTKDGRSMHTARG